MSMPSILGIHESVASTTQLHLVLVPLDVGLLRLGKTGQAMNGTSRLRS